MSFVFDSVWFCLVFDKCLIGEVVLAAVRFMLAGG